MGFVQKYSGFQTFQPAAFLPNLYALGMILQGVSGLPNWVSAFAIVRTPAAGRVIAQGQGYYNIPNSGPLGIKDTFGMMWDSPDFYTGEVDVNSLLSDLSRYKAQVVSPQGFFTEVFQGYSAFSNVITEADIYPNGKGTPDCGVDMMTYCRVPYDIGTGLINPVASGNTMGNNPHALNGYTYTAWNSWRNGSGEFTPVTANQEFTIGSFGQTNPLDGSSRPFSTWGSEPRRQAYYLQVDNLYYTEICGPADYNSAAAKNFHEPCFVTNIVDDSQNVTNNLTQNYLQTGSYIKVSSIIGAFNAAQTNYYLVDERWQDCIPAERPIDPRANANSFVYIQNIAQEEFAWLNVTYMSAATITAIKAAIASAGFYVSSNCQGPVNVYGIYTHTIVAKTNDNLTSAGQKLYGITFNQGLTPDAGDYIIVKYDPCAVIEVFGGDTFIGEYIYPVADCQTKNDGEALPDSDTFGVAAPLPYRAYQYNENTVTIHDNHAFVLSIPDHVPALQAQNFIKASDLVNGSQHSMNIRQLMVNGIVEARTNMDLFFGQVTSGASSMTSASFFPNINYIQRPLIWDSSTSSSNPIHIAPGYFVDYPAENTNWNYGGFRMLPLFNDDYSESPTADQSYSIPSSGFTEQLNFCTRAIWSDMRTTSEQNNPNLKNFPTTNVYDFDDATGGINYAWDSSNAGQQGNLYAFTGHGVVMAETNKSILSSISGGQLAEIGGGNDEFIQAEVWLSRDKGMPDQMWRSAAEYSNTIYWSDKADVYRLNDNKIDDLGQDLKYYKVIYPILQSIAPGYGSDVTAVWVDKYQEYWLCVNPHRIIVQGGFNQTLISSGTPGINQTLVGQDDYLDFVSGLNIFLSSLNHAQVTEFYIANNKGDTLEIFFTSSVIEFMPSGVVWRIFWNGTAWAFDTNPANLCNDVIWGDQVKGFVGQYKYRFDKYTTNQDGDIFGSRLGATFLLDDGYIMNGSNVAAWVLNSFNPKEGYNESKEFIRTRTSCNFMPDQILFFQTVELYNSGTPHSVVSGFPMQKNYGGDLSPSYESYVPRGTNPPNYRNQGRYAIVQTFYAQPTEWFISSQAIQYKILK